VRGGRGLRLQRSGELGALSVADPLDDPRLFPIV
jgi:hypothetical protein